MSPLKLGYRDEAFLSCSALCSLLLALLKTSHHITRCHVRASHGNGLREASDQHPTSTQVLGAIIHKTQNPPNPHLSEFGLRPCDDHSPSWHLECCFVRDPESEVPSHDVTGFLEHRNCEIFNVLSLQATPFHNLLCSRLLFNIVITSNACIQSVHNYFWQMSYKCYLLLGEKLFFSFFIYTFIASISRIMS